MKFVLNWAGRNPWSALGLSLAVSLALSSGIGRLRIDASLAALISGEDPRIRYLDNATANFGNHPHVLMAVHSPDLFTPGVLGDARDFIDRLSAIPGVVKTASLFNEVAPVARGGVVFPGGILPAIPRDPAALERKRRELLENSIVKGVLLNETGDTLGVVFYLEAENPAGKNHERILAQMDAIRDEAVPRMRGEVQVAFLGIPNIKAAIWQRIFWDIKVLGPLSLAVIAVVIHAFYRSLAAVFLPVLTGLLSSAATLGFMGYLGYPINVFLSIIIVLVMVLGCTEDLHILSEFDRNVREGCGRIEAIKRVGISSGRALFLTSATTTFGFLSLAFNGIAGLRAFAVCCAFGMAVNFLITVLVVPAILVLLPPPVRNRGEARIPFMGRLEHVIISIVTRHKAAIAVSSIVFFILAGIGISRLEINSDYLRFCPRDSGPVRANDFISKHFGGAAYLMVTFETNENRGVFDPGNLRALYQLQEFLRKDCGVPFGYLNYLDEFGKALGRPAFTADTLPGESDLESFTGSFPGGMMEEFIDFDASRTAIRLKVDAPSSKYTAAIEARIREFAGSTLPGHLEIRVTGEKSIIDQLSDHIARQLFGNLVMLCLVTAVLIGLFVRSWRQGLLFLVPNLFPLAAIFGSMGWMGIPLGLGTCPVALVAFGIAVDDTIHFLLRYNAERARWPNPARAAVEALSRELHPIVATSVVVASGFVVIMFSPAPLSLDIGILFVISTIAALGADLLVTPLILVHGGGAPPRPSGSTDGGGSPAACDSESGGLSQ